MVQLAEECGGLAKGAVFICTEDAFPAKRLHQMASAFSQRFGSIAETVDFLNNIYIEHISDAVGWSNQRVYSTGWKVTISEYSLNAYSIISESTIELRFNAAATVAGSKANRVGHHWFGWGHISIGNEFHIKSHRHETVRIRFTEIEWCIWVCSRLH